MHAKGLFPVPSSSHPHLTRTRVKPAAYPRPVCIPIERDEETRWDPDETKTKTRARRHVTSGEIPYWEHSHNTSIEPSFRSRVAAPQSLTFLEVRNVWGHISRRIQQLPLNSRVESLTSFLTWFHLEPRSSREEETYRTDLLSNHRSINRRVSRISNFLNSSIDFFGEFACSEGKVSCDSYNCGSRFFARILWRKGYHRWRMRIRILSLNGTQFRRIEKNFFLEMHACMHAFSRWNWEVLRNRSIFFKLSC